ncbi:MAG: hypothetical protein RMJ67_05820 [Elusimicrobiota bacterium]|nr:hypothetical protein [Endomicrobiia bacterium]MDW8166009.1 hypothetical protein [Elusimicrobiota bacterium]
MVRYRSYFRKRNKKNYRFFKKLPFLVIVIFIIYSLFDNFFSFIRINKVYILQNTTTLPNELISQYILNKKINIFNYPFILNELKNKYNEIYKIKLLNIPFLDRNIKISIFGREWIFYISKYNEYIFYSKDKKWYKVYNPSVIVSEIKEVSTDGTLDLEKLYKLNDILDSVGLDKNVYRVEIKHNKEYILYFKEGHIFVFRDNFDLIDEKKILKIYNFLSKKSKVYVCLLNENLVFYNDL